MGATPTFALNIFGFPINDLPKEVARQILKGGSDKANEAGIPILGVTQLMIKTKIWFNSKWCG